MATPTSALAAMNEALADTIAPEGDAGAAGDEGGEGEVDPLLADEPVVDEELADDEEPAADGEGEEAPEGINNRHADGRFKSKAEIAAEVAAKGDAGKPGAAAAKPGAKTADPLNDPIPKDLKQETQDRIRSVIGIAKQEKVAREAVETDMGFIVNGIQATGASPEQYGETLSWLSLFNSNDPGQQEKALELIEGVADRLATMLGRERKVSDPLAGHQDLALEIQQNKLTRERALEIARGRNSQKFNTELRTTAQTHQTQQQAQQQELDTARADLNDLEQTLQAADPQYAQKKAILVQKLKPAFAKLPPSQWAAKFRAEYRTVKLSAPQGQRRSQVPTNQPLRARGGGVAGGAGGNSGNMASQPKNAREAIDGALAKLGV